MLALMVISLCYTLYGIAGLLGFQIIPEQYKGHPWTKDYMRCRGIAYLMLSVPWLAVCWLGDLYFAEVSHWIMILIVSGLAVPSLIYAVVCEKKYKALLEKDTGNAG